MASSNERSETSLNLNNRQSNSKADSNYGKYPSYEGRPPRNARTTRDVMSEPARENVQQDDNRQNVQQQQHRQPNNDDNQEPQRLSLAELFADEPEDENRTGDDNQQNGPVDSIDGLSKRLQLKPEQVYAIKVPMPNGAEPLTIGELKDRVGELVDFETNVAAFDQRRVKAEGELLRAQQEMREIMQLIPKEMIPQVQPLLEKVRKRHETTMTRERQLTLEHIPAWQDEKVRKDEIDGMIEMLSDYGFDETFITTVVDHRALKFIRDTYVTNKRIKSALAKVTIPSKRGKKPSGKTGKAPARPAQNSQPSQRYAGQPDQRSRIVDFFNSYGSD